MYTTYNFCLEDFGLQFHCSEEISKNMSQTSKILKMRNLISVLQPPFVSYTHEQYIILREIVCPITFV